MNKDKKDAAFRHLIPEEQHKNIFKVGKLNVFVSEEMILKHPGLVKKIIKEAKAFEISESKHYL